jgi:predicted glycosyltransferase
VRGLFVQHPPPIENTNTQLQIVNALSGKELSIAMQSAAMVVARAGYTTIMDLVKLQINAILIPTPGQTEQEYLAAHLMRKGMFYSTQQDVFDLEKSLVAANHFPFNIPSFDLTNFEKELDDFFQNLSK